MTLTTPPSTHNPISLLCVFKSAFKHASAFPPHATIFLPVRIRTRREATSIESGEYKLPYDMRLIEAMGLLRYNPAKMLVAFSTYFRDELQRKVQRQFFVFGAFADESRVASSRKRNAKIRNLLSLINLRTSEREERMALAVRKGSRRRSQLCSPTSSRDGMMH